ncbi:hypothetical protein CC80DRAFT_414656, partial [Byssothecium circinans]
NREMKNILPLIYLTAFLFLFGESLQPAPRIEIYERVICQSFYHNNNNSNNHKPNREDTQDCKTAPIQQELAFLIGIERLSIIIPSLLAIPFSALADHLGHNRILSLALLGVLLEESWPFLICWFPAIFLIRLVWLHFFFSLIGGGTTVIVTLLHVIIAKVVDARDRTRVFFRVRAAGVGASILGYAMAGVLMKGGGAWVAWSVGNVSLGLAAAVAIMIPKTVGAGEEEACVDEGDGESAVVQWSAWTGAARTLGKQARGMVVRNGRVLILLASCFLCQLAGDSVGLLMIIYVSKRYGWSFADANMLNSMEMAFEFVSLILLLPLLTSFLSKRGLSAFYNNKYTAQASIAALAVGCICIAFAPVAGIAILGMLLPSIPSIPSPLVLTSSCRLDYNSIGSRSRFPPPLSCYKHGRCE